MLIALLAASALQAAPAPEPCDYAAGQRAPLELSLRARDREGGRTTPVFTHYRAALTSDRRSARTCDFRVPGGGGVAPGETRRIEVICQVPIREGETLEFFELGRPVGSGVVLAPVD